jgi:hypothetical protein
MRAPGGAVQVVPYLQGLGYRLDDGGRVGVARLAFVGDPDGNNVEALGPPLRKVLAGGETSWYFPYRKVLSRRAS